ncbi:putative ribonuclease H-like domain-containing protein [Tanacetum coccineum]
MPESVVNEPKVVSQPKVWTNAPIIEEYESDSDDEHMSLPLKEQETPSFANTIKHVKTPRQTVKQQNTCSKSPKPDKKDYSGLMSKKLGLGYGFTKNACFVCGSFSHLIRDCDFHKKRMAKQAEVNKRMCKGTSQRENKPVWNNVNNVNHQNQLVPTALLTRTSKIQVNTARASSTNNVNTVSTARHNFNSRAVPTNVAKKVNNVKPIVNNLPDENQVLLRVPRQNNMYNFNLKNIVPSRGLAFLITKATLDESNKWHRRLGHVNFKNLNKLVKGNLVRCLPTKISQNTTLSCDACQKGKQHKASYQKIQATKLQVQSKLIIVQYSQENIDAGNSEIEAESAQGLTFTNEKPVDQEDQAFLDELERLKRQEKEANDAAEALESFVDPKCPKKVYKVVKALYGYTKLPEPVKPKEDEIFISQDKYVAEILKKFDFASIHDWLFNILELFSRPDIMFADCACSRFQVTPKTSHLNVVKRIFRYLKGKPKLGLWYPRVSSFDLEAYSDSDYAGANLDRKSKQEGSDLLTKAFDVSRFNFMIVNIGMINQYDALVKGRSQTRQLKKKTRPIINHHKAWFRAARLKKHQKKKDMEKSKKRRSVSKQGRKAVKYSKGAPSVQTHTDWDGLDTDLEATLNEAMDYTLAQDEGKTDSQEDKGTAEKGGSTKGTDLQQSTVKSDEGTNKPDESTVKPDEGTDKRDESTDSFIEGTAEIKDQVSGESDTPTAPTMTLTHTLTVFGDDETIAQVLVTMSQNKPLPKIDPKAKGKGMIEEEDESDTESEDITEAEKKFKMLANDEEMAKKVQEEWEAEEEKKRLAEEEATKAAFTNEYDFIQARLNADKILAEKLQEEEREKFTIEERAKLLHDTIAAQRRFLAQQRSEVKRFDENFIAIGSVKDERLIQDLNKKAAGIKNADSIKEENKEEEDTSEDDETNSEKENDELRLCLTIAPDKDKEVDYEILDKKYPIIEWKSEYLRIKPQYDETKDLEKINLNVVIRSNGQRRYFSTLMRVLSIFDRDDLCAVYQLMMDRYKDEIPEDFDKVLWGDLMIIVHTLMTEAGLVIHMLVEKKYPLRKKVLLQMLELKLESEEDSTMALELIRFVKKLIAELEPENSDGDMRIL